MDKTSLEANLISIIYIYMQAPRNTSPKSLNPHWLLVFLHGNSKRLEASEIKKFHSLKLLSVVSVSVWDGACNKSLNVKICL